jgi:hypothetical protein
MEMELAMATKLLLAAEYFGLSQNSAMVKVMAQAYYHPAATKWRWVEVFYAWGQICNIEDLKKLHIVAAVCNKQWSNVFINTPFIFKAYLSQVALRMEPTLMAHTFGAWSTIRSEFHLGFVDDALLEHLHLKGSNK